MEPGFRRLLGTATLWALLSVVAALILWPLLASLVEPMLRHESLSAIGSALPTRIAVNAIWGGAVLLFGFPLWWLPFLSWSAVASTWPRLDRSIWLSALAVGLVPALFVAGSYAWPEGPLGPFWAEGIRAGVTVLVCATVAIAIPRLLVPKLRSGAFAIAA
jgi:hypothetical protein